MSTAVPTTITRYSPSLSIQTPSAKFVSAHVPGTALTIQTATAGVTARSSATRERTLAGAIT
jgi:hypothetical protein